MTDVIAETTIDQADRTTKMTTMKADPITANGPIIGHITLVITMTNNQDYSNTFRKFFFFFFFVGGGKDTPVLRIRLNVNENSCLTRLKLFCEFFSSVHSEISFLTLNHTKIRRFFKN